jgi:PAS domain S-box-containing protein
MTDEQTGQAGFPRPGSQQPSDSAGAASAEPSRQDQLWQAVLDSAGEGIWGVDLNGRCSFVNKAALRMLSYEAEELVGEFMHAKIHHHYPDGRFFPAGECSIYNVFRENLPVHKQLDHLFRKDGSMFYAEITAQPIVQGGSVHGAVVTFRDVTHTLQAEEALRRSERLAGVGQLASSISHEINNSLESLTNLLYLVRTATSMPDVRTYVGIAEAELRRVSDIATQTLRFHRQQTTPAPVDLGETLPAVLRLYSSRFIAQRIQVKSRLRPTPKAMLLEGDIRQVLNNLIRNAYDAMPEGGDLHVRLRPSTCERTGRPGLRVTVADTGTGFLPKMRQKLFEPFHTSKESTGTGLGLWISKGIIDKHAGRMQMKSRQAHPEKPGHGTLFSLWLPLKEAA